MTTPPMPRIELIPVKLIHPNPDNPRDEAGDVTALARSIKQEGRLLDPLHVVAAPQFGEGHYMIEDGYRRWTAGRQVLPELHCMIVEKSHPAESLAYRELLIAAITDIHKVHLPPMDRAKQYGRLRDQFGMSQAQIAERLGVTDSTVGRYLMLLELSDRAQQGVRDRKIKVDDAVRAVKGARAESRKQSGQRPHGVDWEPDHFSSSHLLARRAQVMCDTRGHTNRRRYGKACGACWETVIRQDQDRVIAAQYKALGLTLAHLPEDSVPISSDGAIRANGVADLPKFNSRVVRR